MTNENQDSDSVVTFENLMFATFGVILGVTAVSVATSGVSGNAETDMMCYMSTSDGECIVKMNTSFPEGYTKHCVSPGQLNKSSMCVLSDSKAEHFTMFRTHPYNPIQVSRGLRPVHREGNEVYVTDFYELVENRSINASKYYTGIEGATGLNLNVCRKSSNESFCSIYQAPNSSKVSLQ